MFKTLARKLARPAVLPAVVAAFAFGGAQPALATDYCVPNGSCAGTDAGTLANALTMAASGPGADRIFLAAGTHTAPSTTGYSYNNLNGPVELIGAGKAQTILTGQPGGSYAVLSLYGGPGTMVRDLKIEPPPNSADSIVGLKTNGTARDILVQEHVNNSGYIVGVVLNGGTIESSNVLISTWHPGNGVILDSGGENTIRDSTVMGRNAVQSSEGGLIERSFLTGSQSGLSASRNLTTIRNSEIETIQAQGTGIAASGHPGIATKVVADGVNLRGLTTASSAVMADTFWGQADNVDVELVNSLIRGYVKRFDARSFGPGVAHISAAYSDYDGAGNSTSGATAKISEANISNIGFADMDEDTLRPFASSQLIDAGDPATVQGVDLDGNPSVTDGNHDGIARRDIGAYELPGPLPGAGETTPPAPVDPPADPPAEPAATPPVADTVAPLVASFRTSHKVFTVTRARTAISARVARGTRFSYSLSESAKVVVTIKRAHTRRAAGRLTRSAKAGRNSLVFSGRIGRKALKRGRYSAAITATDAAGNRSAPRRVSFRVV